MWFYWSQFHQQIETKHKTFSQNYPLNEFFILKLFSRLTIPFHLTLKQWSCSSGLLLFMVIHGYGYVVTDLVIVIVINIHICYLLTNFNTYSKKNLIVKAKRCHLIDSDVIVIRMITSKIYNSQCFIIYTSVNDVTNFIIFWSLGYLQILILLHLRLSSYLAFISHPETWRHLSITPIVCYIF